MNRVDRAYRFAYAHARTFNRSISSRLAPAHLPEGKSVVHSNPSSICPELEQPSPFAVFPSSQASPDVILPSIESMQEQVRVWVRAGQELPP